MNNAIIDTQGLDSSQQAELVRKTWDNPQHPSDSFAARKFTNAAGEPLVSKQYLVPRSNQPVQAAYIRRNTKPDVGELKTDAENWGP